MLPTLPNVKKFPDENGEIKSIYIMNLISVLTLKGDDVFPLN